MLIPDIDAAGRLVFHDYRPSHPRQPLLAAAAGGTLLLETKQVLAEPGGKKVVRFEALITGVDGAVHVRELREDLAAARQVLDRTAAAILRERSRLDIARRLITAAGDALVVIKADFECARLRQDDRARLPEAHRR